MFSFNELKDFYIANSVYIDNPEIARELNIRWNGMFSKFYLHYISQKRFDFDDMMYFINETRKRVAAYRYNSQDLPPFTSNAIIWKDTSCVNILFHEFKYNIRAKIHKASTNTVIADATTELFCSIISNNIEDRGEKINTFPYIGFHLYKSEEDLKNFIIEEDYILAFELSSCNICNEITDSSIIYGQLSYDEIANVYSQNAFSITNLIYFMSKDSQKGINISFYTTPVMDGKVKLNVRKHDNNSENDSVFNDPPKYRIMITSLYFHWKDVFEKIFFTNRPPKDSDFGTDKHTNSSKA